MSEWWRHWWAAIVVVAVYATAVMLYPVWQISQDGGGVKIQQVPRIYDWAFPTTTRRG